MALPDTGVSLQNLPLLTLVLAIGGNLQYGLHISIINSPSKYVQRFINSTWEQRYGTILQPDTVMLFWSIIVSIYSIGGLLGALIVGYLSFKFGSVAVWRYFGCLYCLGIILRMFHCCIPAVFFAWMAFSSFHTVGFFAGTCCCLIYLTVYFYFSTPARWLVSIGVSLNLHTMYIGECAPQGKRGMVTVSVSLAIASGKMMGFIVGLSYAEMENMLAEKEAIGKQMQGVKDFLLDRSVRWQMITLVLVCGALQLVSINAVYFYAYDIFQNAGIPASEAPYVSLGIGITEILTTVLCGILIDRLGRKTLLFMNYVILSLTLTFLTVTLSFQDIYSWLPYASCILIFIFALSYDLGPGGVSCVLPTELFVQTYRPSAYALSGALLWIGLFVIGLSFPFIEETLGTFSFIFFLVYSISMAAFCFWMLPEIKDRSIMEILESFNQLNLRDRKNKFTCTRL